MNLKDIRGQIASIANYKPTNAEHILDMDNLINLAYQETWLARPWSFAQHVIDMNVYPDVDYDDFAKTITVSDFSRTVTFSSAMYILAQQKDDKQLYEGQWIELDGRDYRILKVVSTTEIRLEEPYRGSALSASKAWKLKIRTYNLPEDLVQICNVAHRDHPVTGTVRRNIPALSSKVEETLTLQEDRTSTYADCYMNVASENIPSGEKLASHTVSTSTPCTLTVDKSYEFAWAFKKGNMVGPLSDTIVVTVATGEGGAALPIGLKPYTHDDVLVQSPTYSADADKAPNIWEGLRKVLFINVNYDHTNKERLGIPKWVSVTKYSGTAGQFDHQPLILADEEVEWVIRYPQQISPGNKQYIEIDGQHHNIRFYPRIDSYDYSYAYAEETTVDTTIYHPQQFFKQVELRYLYKPKTLAAITDSPELPYELHNLILYKALDNYYTKIGNAQLAQLYRTRYEQDLIRAEKRYVEHGNISHQRLRQYGGMNYRWNDSRITYKGI